MYTNLFTIQNVLYIFKVNCNRIHTINTLMMYSTCTLLPHTSIKKGTRTKISNDSNTYDPNHPITNNA